MKRMKYIARIISTLLSTVIFLSVFVASYVAAQETLSLSVSGNAEVGGKITVSATVSGAGPYAGFNGSVQYDSKILALDGISAGNYTSKNFQSSGLKFLDYESTIPGGSVLVVATFSCLAVGDTSVSINLDGLGDMNGNDVDATGSSVAVSVKNPVPKSSDKSLKSLSISPGTLTPAFSEGVYEYAAQVDSAQLKITVSAQAKDAKAKITLNGVQNKLVAGKNTVKITVTAEDGSTRVYTITVTKADGPTATPIPTAVPLPTVDIAGKSYTILTPGNSDPIPEGFTLASQSFRSIPIPVFARTFGEAVDAVSVYIALLAGDEGVRYFAYEPKTEAFYPYFEMKLPSMNYSLCSVAPSQVIPKGYESFAYLMEQTEITAYRPISDPEAKQILLYLLDANGVSNFYVYDTVDGLVIPYRGEVLLLDPTPTPTVSPTPSETTSVQTEVTTSASSPEILIPDITPPAGLITLSHLTNFRDPMILLFYIPVILCLALVVAVIILVIRQRRMSFSDDFEDDEPEETPAVPEYRPIVFSKTREQRSYEEDTGTYTSFHEPEETKSRRNPTQEDRPRDSYVYETPSGKVVPRVLLGPENNSKIPPRKSMAPVLDIPDLHGDNPGISANESQNKPLRPGNQVPLFGDPVDEDKKRPIFGDPDEV